MKDLMVIMGVIVGFNFSIKKLNLTDEVFIFQSLNLTDEIFIDAIKFSKEFFA